MAVRRLVVIGTRGSKLALAQTEIVRTALLRLHPHLDVTLQTITTKGDVLLDRPLPEIGGNGVFVQQIEAALRNGVIDAAVHSAKDLPSELPHDMTIAAYLPRADARDVLVSKDGADLAHLPEGARVGTSSPRRTCQLRAFRPDLELLNIRGNVDTRLRKMREGQYDAIVLAAAGLERLDLLDCVSEYLNPTATVPAVGQGALAVEVRASDRHVLDLLGPLNDQETWTAVTAERAFLARIGGGCSLPVGAHATIREGKLTITGMVGSIDGRVVRGERTASTAFPEKAGEALADDLHSRGGRELVEASEVLAE